MIIFDLDGTLWDTVLATERSFADVKEKYNLNDCDISCVKIGMGLSREENLFNYYANYSKEKAEKYLNEVSINLNRYITEDYITIYGGVKQIIKELSKEYKLGIVTNNNDNYVKIFLKLSHLEKYFDDYVGASTYGITKQEAISKIIARHSEKFNVYVGDIKKDMDAALGAGIEFIHAKYGFGNDFSYKYGINNFYELLDVIKCITKNNWLV